MDTQVDQSTVHPMLQIPYCQLHPTKHKTHEKIHHPRQTDLQLDLTMPHRTCAYWRILPPICTRQEPNVSLFRYFTNTTSHPIRMQNSLLPPTYPRNRKSL